MSTKIVQVKPLTLSSNIGTSNTTAIVTGMVGLDGVDLTQTDFGTIIYGTFEPNTTREEAVSFTITSNTAGVANINFTASGRGLIGKSPYGTGGITYSHSAGAKLVISNNPNLFNNFTAKNNAEVVTAQWQFPTPTGNSSPATKQYADALVSLGAPEATALARGISILSASPNVTIGTATITVATPAVVSKTAHGLIVGDSIQFTTTGALPTGLTASTTYFVISAGFGANSFQVGLTLGGAAINTTGTQSGTHTLIEVTPIAVGYNDAVKLPTVGEKAALAGGGAFGTPSGSNKFLTQDYLTSLPNVQEFSTTGTWTKPAAGTYAIVDVIGSGGSGGAVKDNTDFGVASGGSGGAYRQFIIKLSNLSATETVTIGTGGASVSASSDNQALGGNAGSVSWFKDTSLSANGGLAGASLSSGSPISRSAIAGGTAATILIFEGGGASGGASNNPAAGGGGVSPLYSGAGGAGAATSTASQSAGTGGSSLFTASTGGAASATIGTGGATAVSGTKGGGGGAAVVTNATGSATSGAGGNGYIRVTVF